MQVLGIDIGGSGVKGAPVNTKTGELLEERYRIPTPDPATPQAVGKVISQIAKHFHWKKPIGCGYPGVIRNNIALTAANVCDEWIGTNLVKLFSELTGCDAAVVNDADAAGIAEIAFGAGKDCKGKILVITVGTGLGTALFMKHKLLRNTEFGHIIMSNGMEGESYASDAVRKNLNLSWQEWAKRFNEYLVYLNKLFYPDLIIIGGGASKKGEKYMEYLNVDTDIVTATLRNHAGIIGAALSVEE